MPLIEAVTLRKAAAPGTPSAAQLALYAKADGLAYSKDDAGVERVVTGVADWTRPTAAARTNAARNQRFDNALGFLLSGRLNLVAIWLEQGDVVSTITFHSGTVAAATPTAQWFALYDAARGKLGVTNDDTITAWATNAAKTLTLASAYTVTAAGLYYAGIMVTATTVPNLLGLNNVAQLIGRPPILAGSSSTGQTTPALAPATAAAITAQGAVPYVEIA